jgi:signal transduction histidine kinase
MKLCPGTSLVPGAHPLRRGLCLAGVLALSGPAAQAFEGYSDPLMPPAVSELSAVQGVPFFKIPARLKQVAQEIDLEAQTLHALAPLQVGKQFDRFGYHSDYLPAVDGVPDEPLWTLTFSAGAHPTLGFVMVPAFDQRSPDLRGYAFPKRFRICSVDAQGGSDRVLVDWTTRDFPDPGMRPVYFGIPSENASKDQLRLEVFDGHQENGLEFFALGRIHLIRQDEQQKIKRVTASSSFQSPPYWSKAYLASSRHTLGMPLSARDGAGGTLTFNVPSSTLEMPLVIRVELDKTDELGWVNLFPGQCPDGIDVPGYGFPKTMTVYRIFPNSSGDGERRFRVLDQEFLENPGNNMVRLAGSGREVDALEIECNDFPVYQGQAVFSLGEIEGIRGERNLSKGRRVTIRGVDLEETPDLVALVDGRVDGRNILLLPEWLQQLAAGKPHEARLRALDAERTMLTERWLHVRTVFLTSLIIFVCAGILVFVFLMMRSRKLAEIRLRRQINSDLHDDIGSKIAAISLASRDVELHASDDRVRKRGVWIGSVVNTMHQSLRDVLWLTSDQTDTLVLLVQKLAETARQSVPESQLTLRISDVSSLPHKSIPLQTKRDILFFAKEVLHNATTHAEATQIRVRVMADKNSLTLCIVDDGKGFEVPSAEELNGSSGHFGLRTMRERAGRLGAEFQLQSSPGQGTNVELTVKL